MLSRLIDLFQEYPIGAIGHLMLLLPVCLAVYRRQYLNGALLLIAIYFLIHFLEETVLLYYVLLIKNTISIQRGFFIIDAFMIGELIYLTLKQRKQSKKAGIILSVVIIALISIAYFISDYSFISSTLFKLLLIYFSIAYFNKILDENRIRSVVQHAMFWVSSGFLIYGMGTFLTSLFSDYLLDPQQTSDQMFALFWNMGQILSIIQCTLTAIGFWVSRFDRLNYIQPI